MAGKIAAFFGTQDLTQGKPMRGLIQFSVPLLIGNLSQQLYNTVDSIVVGKYVSDNALAAVGASGPVLNLLLVLFMGIATGATIMVSQYFGARQHQLLSITVGNTITLTVLSSIFIMVVGPLVTYPLMTMLNTPKEIYDDSCSYLIIIFLGIIGIAGYNVQVPNSSLKLHRDLVLRLTKLGLPSGLAQAIFSLAAIVVQSLTNSFGPMVITASIIVMRVDGFAMMPNFTFGTAMTTYSGQNIGAGKLDRVHEGTKAGTILGLIVSAALTVVILLFGRILMGWFTNTQAIVDMGFHMMCILAVGYIAMSVTQGLSGVMRGAGDTMTPMWISFITTVVIRVPIAYGIAYFTRSEAWPNGNPDCLYISLLISWVMGALITYFCYRRGKWRNKAVTGATEVTE